MIQRQCLPAAVFARLRLQPPDARREGDTYCWDVQTPVGLGDRVASALAAVGITEELVSKALGRPCGCGKRKKLLNEWGRRLGIGGKVE